MIAEHLDHHDHHKVSFLHIEFLQGLLIGDGLSLEDELLRGDFQIFEGQDFSLEVEDLLL